MKRLLESDRILWIYALAWISVWIVPWGDLLTFQGNFLSLILVDMIRLGMAIFIFIIPGALLYMIFGGSAETRASLKGIIPIGFTYSTLFIGTIGLLGRLLGFSFVLVKILFAFFGLLVLLYLFYKHPKINQRKIGPKSVLREMQNNPSLLAALFFGVLFLVNAALFFIDDFTYLAYLTEWQNSTHLNFTEVIFGTSSTDPSRFWLALYPMGQALLSDLSGVSGILLMGKYLEIFLVIISILAMYHFAQTLGLSKRLAGFSVLVQITLLGWTVGGGHNPVGFWYILHMAEDKVSATFILAPVIFSLLIIFIESPNKRNFLAFLLAGFSLSVTHPIILFFMACIIFGISIISWLMHKITWFNVLQLVAAIVIWMIPYVGVRFSNHPSIADMAYDGESVKGTLTVDMLLNIREDGLYGMNPEVLMFLDANVGPDLYQEFQNFRAIPIIIVMVAGLIGLWRINRGHENAYVVLTAILILFALIPHTGRILGYFISARQLFRASWFASLGLGIVVIGKYLSNFITLLISHLSKKRNNGWLDKSLSGLHSRLPMLGFTFFVMVGFASPSTWRVANHAPLIIPQWKLYKQLSLVGNYISQNEPNDVTVITLNETDDYLPGISAKAIPVSFREEANGYAIKYFFSFEELEERKSDSDVIQSLDQKIPVCERHHLINKYQIQYILAESSQSDQFLNIMNTTEMLIKPVFRTENLLLFAVGDFSLDKACSET